MGAMTDRREGWSGTKGNTRSSVGPRLDAAESCGEGLGLAWWGDVGGSAERAERRKGVTIPTLRVRTSLCLFSPAFPR